MLKSLYIKNYALIKDIQINFEDTFTTITGETGSGKSIILGALNLLLGSRTDKDSLRDTGQKCILEAEFDFTNHALQRVFEKFDLDYHNNSIIRREITLQKTRAFINDTPVKIKVLQKLKHYFIDIHSQNESFSLVQTNFQYNVIDKIAKNTTILKEYQTTLQQYEKIQKEIHLLNKQKDEDEKQQDYNQFLYDELENFDLTEGIVEDLEKSYKVLQNAEEIQYNLSECLQLLRQEEQGVYDKLIQIKNSFPVIAASFAENKDLYNRINSIILEVEDIATDFETATESIEVNPEKLHIVEQELQSIYSIQKKHQVTTVLELLQIKNQLNQKLLSFSNYEKKLEKLQKVKKTQEENLNKLSNLLLKNRLKASTLLTKKLIEILKKLGMQESAIKVEILPTKEYNQYGKDSLKWLFSANKGVELKPIYKIASGGELSRIMLAIKSLLADYEKLPCIIFDEIDTGVSGDIAAKMGDIMYNMSTNMQVISITHLPQIASKGKQHLKVYKNTTTTTTETIIKKLSKEERLVELSIMLGGNKNSNSALEHAKSLLK